MVKVKPFAAIRPPKAIVKEVAARPYDVLNSQEAKAEAGEKSLLHITKPEIDFDPIIDEHSQPAYDKAVQGCRELQEVAGERLARAGQEGVLLCLRPDHERPYPVRYRALCQR